LKYFGYLKTSIVKKSIPAQWKQIIKNEESIMTKVNVSFFNTPIYLNSQSLNNKQLKLSIFVLKMRKSGPNFSK
jgi:hypothetical protein